MVYYLYILKCKDESLYTGITTDLKRRVIEHNSKGVGAKYTAGRRPVKLIYSKEFKNRSEATKEEAMVKKFKRIEKLALVAGRARVAFKRRMRHDSAESTFARHDFVQKSKFKFKSKVIVWGAGGREKKDDSGNWRFARVPEDISAKIKEMAHRAKQNGVLRRGWGAVYVLAKIGKSEWKTSVFPDRHSSTYILPLKKEIRYEENLYDGAEFNFSIEVWF